MAKFCINCGSALREGSNFCPQCGAPVQKTVQQPQQTQTAQKQQELSVKKEPVKKTQKQPQKTEKKKKGKGGLVAVIVILLVAVIGVAGFLGFREGGWFRSNKNQGRPTTYDGNSDIDALLDYADRLEEAGNEEAAAIIRSRIPDAAAGEANQKLEEMTEENEELQVIEIIKDALEISGWVKGGKMR